MVNSEKSMLFKISGIVAEDGQKFGYLRRIK